MGLAANLPHTGGFLVKSGGLRASGKFGDTGMPGGVLSFADGTGSGQANFVYKASLSISASATTLIDLKGGNGELDVLNVAMAATAVKFVLLEITTPGAGVSLRFGPQNQTNAAQLWFSGVGTTAYATVLHRLRMEDSVTGWAVGSSTKVLAVNNPSASTVAATLLVIGTK